MSLVTFITPVDITPGISSAWTDADLLPYIPSGCPGVVLLFINSGTSTNKNIGWRPNGSTDSWTTSPAGYGKAVATCGVDSSRILELFVNLTSNQITVYLLGYFDADAAKFFVNGIDKSAGSTGSYQLVDIFGNTGNDTAVAALLEYKTSSGAQSLWTRMYGSTDDYYYNVDTLHNGAVVALDGWERFEQKISSTNVDILVKGYLLGGARFYRNLPDYSLSSAGAYVDLTALPAGAESAFMAVISTSATDYLSALRKNGSSDDFYGLASQSTNIVECDGSGIIEGKIEDTSVDFRLVGYGTNWRAFRAHKAYTDGTMVTSLRGFVDTRGMTNPRLFVHVWQSTYGYSGGSANGPTTRTFNGSALSQYGSDTNPDSNTKSQRWYMDSPGNGLYELNLAWTGGNDEALVLAYAVDCADSTWVRDIYVATKTTTSPSGSVSACTDDIVIDMLAMSSGSSDLGTVSAANSQDIQAEVLASQCGGIMVGSLGVKTATSDGNITMGYTISGGTGLNGVHVVVAFATGTAAEIALFSPAAADTATTIAAHVDSIGITSGDIICILLPATDVGDRPSKAQILAKTDKANNPAAAWRAATITGDGTHDFSSISGWLAELGYTLCFAHPAVDDPVFYDGVTDAGDAEDYSPVVPYHYHFVLAGGGQPYWHWYYPWMQCLTIGGYLKAVMVAYGNRPTDAQLLLGHDEDNAAYQYLTPDGLASFNITVSNIIESDPRAVTQSVGNPTTLGSLDKLFGGWLFAMMPLTPSSDFTCALMHVVGDRITTVFQDITVAAKN